MLAIADQFRKIGNDAPFIEVLMGDQYPVKRVEFEPGSFNSMEGDIEVDINLEGGGWETLGRILTGESLMVLVCTCKPGKSGIIRCAGPNPGAVQSINVKPGDAWNVQFDGFICGGNTKMKAKLVRDFKAAILGGEGLLMQHITTEGTEDGIAFIDGGGSILEVDLKAGEKITVDTGCIVAYQETVMPGADFILQRRGVVQGLLQTVLGGEGIAYATLTGPGRCYIESLPHARRRARMQGEGQEGSGAAFFEQLKSLGRVFGSQK